MTASRHGAIPAGLMTSHAPENAPPQATGKEGAGVALPGSIGFLLRRLQLEYKRHFARAAAHQPLQLHEVGIISLIGRNPGMTPSALAAVLSLDAAQVTNVLKGLEAQGLVSRHRSLSDSRSRRFRLTEAGEAELERAAKLVEEVDSAFIGSALTPRERATLLDLLDRLMRVRPRM